MSLGYPAKDKQAHQAINESVNKCKDMDEGVDERLKDMHESVNRNVNIALISRNDVRPRLDFRGNSVANELNKDEYHLKEIQTYFVMAT